MYCWNESACPGIMRSSNGGKTRRWSIVIRSSGLYQDWLGHKGALTTAVGFCRVTCARHLPIKIHSGFRKQSWCCLQSWIKASVAITWGSGNQLENFWHWAFSLDAKVYTDCTPQEVYLLKYSVEWPIVSVWNVPWVPICLGIFYPGMCSAQSRNCHSRHHNQRFLWCCWVVQSVFLPLCLCTLPWLSCLSWVWWEREEAFPLGFTTNFAANNSGALMCKVLSDSDQKPPVLRYVAPWPIVGALLLMHTLCCGSGKWQTFHVCNSSLHQNSSFSPDGDSFRTEM